MHTTSVRSVNSGTVLFRTQGFCRGQVAYLANRRSLLASPFFYITLPSISDCDDYEFQSSPRLCCSVFLNHTRHKTSNTEPYISAQRLEEVVGRICPGIMCQQVIGLVTSLLRFRGGLGLRALGFKGCGKVDRGDISRT